MLIAGALPEPKQVRAGCAGARPLIQDLEKEHGRSAVLECRSPMKPTAQNAYTVRYSLQHPDDVRFALPLL
jgi:hypothetical protein